MPDRVQCKACGHSFQPRKDGLPRGHGGPDGSECRSPTAEGQALAADPIANHLAETRRIAEAATPGPWQHELGEHWKHGKPLPARAVGPIPDSIFALPVAVVATSEADAAHTAHMDPAHTLRLVRALEVAVDPWRDSVCECDESVGWTCMGCGIQMRIGDILRGDYDA